MHRSLRAIHGRRLQALTTEREQGENVADHTEYTDDGHDVRAQEGAHVLHGDQVETSGLGGVGGSRTAVIGEDAEGDVVVGQIKG